MIIGRHHTQNLSLNASRLVCYINRFSGL